MGIEGNGSIIFSSFWGFWMFAQSVSVCVLTAHMRRGEASSFICFPFTIYLWAEHSGNVFFSAHWHCARPLANHTNVRSRILSLHVSRKESEFNLIFPLTYIMNTMITWEQNRDKYCSVKISPVLNSLSGPRAGWFKQLEIRVNEAWCEGLLDGRDSH